jgi:hypothetical protein
MSNLLVLGATSDVAQALAHRFAAHGFNIVLAARETDRLASVMSDLEIRYNAQVHTVEFNALDYGMTILTFTMTLPAKPDLWWPACSATWEARTWRKADFSRSREELLTLITPARFLCSTLWPTILRNAGPVQSLASVLWRETGDARVTTFTAAPKAAFSCLSVRACATGCSSRMCM